MESIISTFHIDWKIIVAQAINFSVVFIVFYIYALKPLSKLMDERADKIAKGVEDAKANEALLKDTSLKYKEVLNNARNEASKIFAENKKEVEQKKALMLEDAKNQVTSMIESGKKALENEKVKMVGEARKEIVSLTMVATEKLIGAQSQSQGKSFNDEALEELRGIK